MLRQQAQGVDAAEEVELRRLEGHLEACRAVAVLAAARVVADGEHAPIGLRLAQAWPVAGLRDADAGSPPPWPTREVFAPRADAVVRPGSTGPVDGHGVSLRPPLKKTKRMDRRLSHWKCTFCGNETPLSEQVDVCGMCNGARQQLGDSGSLDAALGCGADVYRTMEPNGSGFTHGKEGQGRRLDTFGAPPEWLQGPTGVVAHRELSLAEGDGVQLLGHEHEARSV